MFTNKVGPELKFLKSRLALRSPPQDVLAVAPDSGHVLGNKGTSPHTVSMEELRGVDLFQPLLPPWVVVLLKATADMGRAIRFSCQPKSLESLMHPTFGPILNNDVQSACRFLRRHDIAPICDADTS